jgi:hypothetical protein
MPGGPRSGAWPAATNVEHGLLLLLLLLLLAVAG